MSRNEGPSGTGWWIWYLSRVLHGRSYEQLAAVCRQNSITHLLVKAGDAGNAWTQLAPCVKPLQAGGLKVYGWTYCYGDDPAGEAEVAKAALATGCDGMVLDIEGEAEGKHAAIQELWQRIRDAYPDAWIGWAPLPVVDYHDPDLYRIACRYADAHLPQFYWAELGPQYGDLGYLTALWLGWQERWKVERLPQLPILPIGQAYGSVTPEEMRGFTDYAQRFLQAPAISWWEWYGSSEEQWQAVAEIATAWGQPAPAPAPSPLLAPLNGLWWTAEQLDAREPDLAQRVRDYVGQIKQMAGLN